MKTREEMQAAHDAFWATIEGTVPNPGLWHSLHVELSELNANTLCWCIDCENDAHREMLDQFERCVTETVRNVEILKRQTASSERAEAAE